MTSNQCASDNQCMDTKVCKQEVINGLGYHNSLVRRILRVWAKVGDRHTFVTHTDAHRGYDPQHL